MFILLFKCTTWTLTERLKKEKLDGNYARMLNFFFSFLCLYNVSADMRSGLLQVSLFEHRRHPNSFRTQETSCRDLQRNFAVLIIIQSYCRPQPGLNLLSGDNCHLELFNPNAYIHFVTCPSGQSSVNLGAL